MPVNLDLILICLKTLSSPLLRPDLEVHSAHSHPKRKRDFSFTSEGNPPDLNQQYLEQVVGFILQLIVVSMSRQHLVSFLAGVSIFSRSSLLAL